MDLLKVKIPAENCFNFLINVSTLRFIGYFFAWNISHLPPSKLGASNWTLEWASLRRSLHLIIAWKQVPPYIIYFSIAGFSSQFDLSPAIVQNVKKKTKCPATEVSMVFCFDPWATFPLVLEILRKTKFNTMHTSTVHSNVPGLIRRFVRVAPCRHCWKSSCISIVPVSCICDELCCFPVNVVQLFVLK